MFCNSSILATSKRILAISKFFIAVAIVFDFINVSGRFIKKREMERMMTSTVQAPCLEVKAAEPAPTELIIVKLKEEFPALSDFVIQETYTQVKKRLDQDTNIYFEQPRRLECLRESRKVLKSHQFVIDYLI
jgi:hypothetical protein